jgi:hypothetical protein
VLKLKQSRLLKRHLLLELRSQVGVPKEGRSSDDEAKE